MCALAYHLGLLCSGVAYNWYSKVVAVHVIKLRVSVPLGKSIVVSVTLQAR